MSKASRNKGPDANLGGIDFSVIRTAIEAGGKMIDQILNGVHYGSQEIRMLLREECDMILECRVCRALFRSLPNFVAHKRVYCQQAYHNHYRDHFHLASGTFTSSREPPIVTVEPAAPPDNFLSKSGRGEKKKSGVEDKRQKSDSQRQPAVRKLRSNSNSTENSDAGKGTSNGTDCGRPTRDRGRSAVRSSTLSDMGGMDVSRSNGRGQRAGTSQAGIGDRAESVAACGSKTNGPSTSGSTPFAAGKLGALADTVRQIEDGTLGNSAAFHLYSAAAEKMAEEDAQEKPVNVCLAPIVSNSNAVFISTSERGLEQIVEAASSVSPEIHTLAENGRILISKTISGSEDKGKSESALVGTVVSSRRVAGSRSSMRYVSKVVGELRRSKEETERKVSSQTDGKGSKAASKSGSSMPAAPRTPQSGSSSAGGTSRSVDSVSSGPAFSSTPKQLTVDAGSVVTKMSPDTSVFPTPDAVSARTKLPEGRQKIEQSDNASTSSSPKQENVPPSRMETRAVVKQCLTGHLGAVRSSPLKIVMAKEVAEKGEREEDEDDDDQEEEGDEESLPGAGVPSPYESAMDLENIRCKICNKHFVQRQSLVYHCRARHSGHRTIFPCPYCPCVFYYFYGLTRHLNNNHQKSHSEIDRMRKRLRQKSYRQDVVDDERESLSSRRSRDRVAEGTASKARPSIPARKLVARLSGSSSDGSPSEAAGPTHKKHTSNVVSPAVGSRQEPDTGRRAQGRLPSTQTGGSRMASPLSPAVTRSSGGSRAMAAAAASSVRKATLNIYRKTYPSRTRSARLRALSPQAGASSSLTQSQSHSKRSSTNPCHVTGHSEAEDSDKSISALQTGKDSDSGGNLSTRFPASGNEFSAKGQGVLGKVTPTRMLCREKGNTGTSIADPQPETDSPAALGDGDKLVRQTATAANEPSAPDSRHLAQSTVQKGLATLDSKASGGLLETKPSVSRLKSDASDMVLAGQEGDVPAYAVNRKIQDERVGLLKSVAPSKQLGGEHVSGKLVKDERTRPPSSEGVNISLCPPQEDGSQVISSAQQSTQPAASLDAESTPLHICPHCQRAFGRKISLDSHVKICSKAPAQPKQKSSNAAAREADSDTKTGTENTAGSVTRVSRDRSQSKEQGIKGTELSTPGLDAGQKTVSVTAKVGSQSAQAPGNNVAPQRMMTTRLRSKDPVESSTSDSSVAGQSREKYRPVVSSSADVQSRASRASVSPARSGRSSSRDSSISSRSHEVNSSAGRSVHADRDRQWSAGERGQGQDGEGGVGSQRMSRADRATRRDQTKAVLSSRESSLESVDRLRSADVHVHLNSDRASRLENAPGLSRSGSISRTSSASRLSNTGSVTRSRADSMSGLSNTGSVTRSRADSMSGLSNTGSMSRSSRADTSSRASCSSRDSSVESHSRTRIRHKDKQGPHRPLANDMAARSVSARRETPSQKQELAVEGISSTGKLAARAAETVVSPQGSQPAQSSQRPKRKRRAPRRIADDMQVDEEEKETKTLRLDYSVDDGPAEDSVDPAVSDLEPMTAEDFTVEEMVAALNVDEEDDEKTLRLVEEIWMDKKPGRPSERVKSNRIYVIEPARAGRLTCQDTRKVGQIVDEGGLECKQCQQRFTSVSNLRRHAIRHLGWRRFKCRLCRFCSYNRSECNTHILRAHPERLRASGSGGPRIDNFITDLNRQAASVRSTKKRRTLDSRRSLDTKRHDVYLRPKSHRLAAREKEWAKNSSQDVTPETGTKPDTSSSGQTTPPRPTTSRRKSATPTSREESRRTRLNAQRFNISTRNSPRKFDTRPYPRDDLSTLCTRKGFYAKPSPGAKPAIPTALSQRLEKVGPPEESGCKDIEMIGTSNEVESGSLTGAGLEKHAFSSVDQPFSRAPQNVEEQSEDVSDSVISYSSIASSTQLSGGHSAAESVKEKDSVDTQSKASTTERGTDIPTVSIIHAQVSQHGPESSELQPAEMGETVLETECETTGSVGSVSPNRDADDDFEINTDASDSPLSPNNNEPLTSEQANAYPAATEKQPPSTQQDMLVHSSTADAVSTEFGQAQAESLQAPLGDALDG